MKTEHDSAEPSDFPALAALLGHLDRELSAAREQLGSGPWLIGFSHGPDSTLLLSLLARLRVRCRLPELIAVHVDHRARVGSELEADRAVAFANQLGIACRLLVRPSRASETDARRQRFAGFRELAHETGASALLLAHHRNDDLETVVLRLLRGTGPLGLSGIPKSRRLTESCVLYRPMLGVRKADIDRAVAELGLPHLVDPTNLEPSHTPRNRVRSRVLPALGEDAVAKLLDQAKAFRAAVGREAARLPKPEDRDGTLRIPLPVGDVSPWARELFWNRVFDALGRPRPPRHLVLDLAALLGPGCRTGRIVESLGYWRARRYRDEVVFETLDRGCRAVSSQG